MVQRRDSRGRFDTSTGSIPPQPQPAAANTATETPATTRDTTNAWQRFQDRAPTRRVAVRHLQPGDTLDSGLIIDRAPYTQVRMSVGRNRVYVEGHYPGQPSKRYAWNPSTAVNVVDNAG